MVDETPMSTILCPIDAKMAELRTWSTSPQERRVPRSPPAHIEAIYECEGGHEIRMTVAMRAGFGGTGASA